MNSSGGASQKSSRKDVAVKYVQTSLWHVPTVLCYTTNCWNIGAIDMNQKWKQEQGFWKHTVQGAGGTAG